MKAILALSLFISFSSFASTCPELSGDYVCQKGSHISYKSIEKTETGYIVVSDGVEMEYATDGKTYDLPSTESVKDAKVVASCKNNVFVVDFTGTILYEGSELAKQVSKTEYSLKGDKMIYSQKIKMKGLPMPALTLACTKN